MSKSSVAASRQKLLKLVQLALLTAIIAIMAFIPSIGYIRTPLFEITLIVVPVVLGAVLLGPSAGLFLGTVFGLTSFIQCFGLDAFGTTLLSINPIFTFIMCIVPRVLMGYLCAVIYKLIARKKRKAAYVIGALSAPIFNTTFFMTLLILFFGKSDYIMGFRGNLSLVAFLAAFIGLNGIMEIVTTTVIAPPVASVIHKAIKKIK
jgi:uncharacterized membrane protein